MYQKRKESEWVRKFWRAKQKKKKQIRQRRKKKEEYEPEHRWREISWTRKCYIGWQSPQKPTRQPQITEWGQTLVLFHDLSAGQRIKTRFSMQKTIGKQSSFSDWDDWQACFHRIKAGFSRWLPSPFRVPLTPPFCSQIAHNHAHTWPCVFSASSGRLFIYHRDHHCCPRVPDGLVGETARNRHASCHILCFNYYLLYQLCVGRKWQLWVATGKYLS